MDGGSATLVRGVVGSDLNHTDLGAIAVGDDDVEALFDEVDDGSSRVVNQLELLFRGYCPGRYRPGQSRDAC